MCLEIGIGTIRLGVLEEVFVGRKNAETRSECEMLPEDATNGSCQV